jgi:hypothetical protein
MTDHDFPNLARTAAAIAAYDAFADRHYGRATVDALKTDADVEAWVARDRAEMDKVINAYADDTADRNSRKTLLQVMPMKFARRMANDWTKQQISRTASPLHDPDTLEVYP